MIRSVLVHTDIDSEQAGLMLRLVGGLRALGVERIVLANVIDASGMEGPVIAARVDRIREALKEAADRLRTEGLEVEVRVPTGDAERELLALSAEGHVDAVLSGSHAKSTMDRFFAGSVSASLAARSTVPNIVVRFEDMAASADPADLLRSLCKRLVIPTDFSEAADRALDVALSLPTECTESMLLVHVRDDVPDVEEKLEARRGRAEAAGVDARFVMRKGDVAATVVAEAGAHEATGVVVGSRGGGTPWEELVLGSVSLALLREAPCPVIIVP